MFDLLERAGLDYTALPCWLINHSRRIHNRLWSDKDQSLCARVWAAQCRPLLWLLGPKHCRASWQFYHPGQEWLDS